MRSKSLNVKPRSGLLSFFVLQRLTNREKVNGEMVNPLKLSPCHNSFILGSNGLSKTDRVQGPDQGLSRKTHSKSESNIIYLIFESNIIKTIDSRFIFILNHHNNVDYTLSFMYKFIDLRIFGISPTDKYFLHERANHIYSSNLAQIQVKY